VLAARANHRSGTQREAGPSPKSTCPAALARTRSRTHTLTVPSDPTNKPPSADASPPYRYPDEVTAEDLAAMDRVVDVDAEAYLRWLESGKGPEPCEPESSE
jgi:hypothetical protein